MQRDCIDHFDTIDCQASVNFCNSELSTGYWASGTSSGLLLFIVSPSRPAFFHRAERVRYFKGKAYVTLLDLISPRLRTGSSIYRCVKEILYATLKMALSQITLTDRKSEISLVLRPLTTSRPAVVKSVSISMLTWTNIRSLHNFTLPVCWKEGYVF